MADIDLVRIFVNLLRAATVATVALLCTVGTAAAASGTVSHLNGSTNAASLTVTFTTSGSVASHQVERRTAPLMAGTCSTYGTWGALSAVNPTSPYIDSSITHGHCVQYRVRITDTSSVTTYATSPSVARIDRSAPTGLINAAPTVVSGVSAITGAADDFESGVASTSLTYSGPTSGTACTSMPGSSWTCNFDSYMIPDGFYEFQLEIVDLAGNVSSPITRMALVDNSLATISMESFVESVNPQYQHTVGATMYFNPAMSGAFVARASAGDAGSGVDNVTFPALGSGWTPTVAQVTTVPGYYNTTYAFTAGAGNPGPQTIFAYDLAGNAASTTFSVVADSTAPVGGTASTTGSAIATVSFTMGSDVQSGVARTQLQRRDAVLSAGMCQAYSAWANLGSSNPTSPYIDTTIPANRCAEYRIVITDNVGNEAYVVSSGVAQNGGSGDATAPTVTISASPVSPVSGATVPLSGASSDAGSGVQSVVVTATGPAGSNLAVCSRVAPASLNPWSCSFDTTILQDGTYTLRATATDVAGNTADASRTILLDNHPPTLGFPGYVEQANPQYQHATGSYMYFNPAHGGSFQVTISSSDAGVGMSHVLFPSFGAGWSPSTPTTSMSGPIYAASYSWTAGASAPGFRDVVGVDLAGNSSTAAQIRIQADSVPPVLSPGTLTWDASPARARLTVALPTDASSGLGDWGLERREAPRTSGGCDITFGPWAAIGAIYTPPNHFDEQVAPDRCYEYRYFGVDRVGNHAVAPINGPSTFGTLPPASSGGVIVNSSALTPVQEGGTTSHVDIHLDQQPTDDVVIVATTDWQTTANSNVLTFNEFNWQTPQRMTIVAVDDAVSEGAHNSLVSFMVQSTDPEYVGTTVNPLVVDVVDNDAPGLTVQGGQLDVHEAGTTSDTFEMSLWSEPTADVTVALSSAAPGEVVLTPATLTFSPTNWNVPQTVTVTAVDDSAVEGAHSAVIHVDVASTDPLYALVTSAPLQVQITDNDFGTSPDVAPPIGGAISVPDVVTNGASMPVSFVVGSDSGSGIATWRVQRRIAVLQGGQCMSYTAWADVAEAQPVSPLIAPLASGVCLQYRLVVGDAAGNVATWNASGTVRVDRTAPTGTIRVPQVDGSDVVFDGLAGDTGTPTRVSVTLDGSTTETVCSDVATTGSDWSCRIAAARVPAGDYEIVLTVTDDAGNTFVTRRAHAAAPVTTPPATTPTTPEPPRTPTGTAPVDTSKPVLEAVKLDPVTFGTNATVKWTASDDSGTAPTARVERRSITPTGAWTAWTNAATSAATPFAMPSGSRGTTTCIRITAVDAAGNASMPRTACTSVPLDDRDLTASSGWKLTSSGAAFARTLTTSLRSTSTGTLSTSTRGWSELSLVATTCPGCGSVRVLVGKRVVDTISLASRTARSKVVLPIDAGAQRATAKITLAHVSGTGATKIDGLVVDR